MIDFLKALIRENFDKLFLAALFFGGAYLLVKYPDNERLAQWVQGGAIVGAILMLITGNKKTTPSPDGPTAGKVITDTHTEEVSK
jgi:hypothetical protein